MPRACSICTHPSATEIDKELVSGTSNRRIASQFQVVETSLRRHKNEHLLRLLAENSEPTHEASQPSQHAPIVAFSMQRRQDEAEHVFSVMGELSRLFQRINLLYDACHEWLRDPDNPERYTIAARSEEIEVIYLDHTDTTPAGAPKKKRERLSVLLDRFERASGHEPQRAETRIADPRELILKTANQLQGQTQLLQAVQDKLRNAEEEQRFRSAILTAIAEVDSDVRQRIIDHLQRRGPLGTVPR